MFARYWEKFLKVAYTTTSCRMRSGVRELDLHICDSAATVPAKVATIRLLM